MAQVKAKIWIEQGGIKIFGDGPWDILTRVERTGSLRQAVAEIKMSYSQAWRLLRIIEKKLGFPLLEKQTGGAGGGYSMLTARAKALICAYSQFRIEAEQTLNNLHQAYLADL
ncbi:MAG: LysR family transcriptional regulator [Firmicutes bacterium]|nr:LysR family transcriptional regulator [Bacillota bacterium]